MNEFLSALFQTVIIAAVPVCTGAVIKGIRAAARYLAAKAESETVRKYLEDVASAISTAVTYTSQVYVDALKHSNSFTKENQEEALSLAIREAVNLMRYETITFLKETYGDINDYLVSRIEAEVRAQKLKNSIFTLGEPVAAELSEAPDVTSVAAATAAATAAAVVQTTVSQAIPVGGTDSPVEGGEQ